VAHDHGHDPMEELSLTQVWVRAKENIVPIASNWLKDLVPK